MILIRFYKRCNAFFTVKSDLSARKDFLLVNTDILSVLLSIKTGKYTRQERQEPSIYTSPILTSIYRLGITANSPAFTGAPAFKIKIEVMVDKNMSVPPPAIKFESKNLPCGGTRTAMDHSEILAHYDDLSWVVVSGDMSWDGAAKKGVGAKVFKFHSASWKDDPVRRNGATGYALLTGKRSGITAIDVDDMKLEHNMILSRLCEEAGAIKQVSRKGNHYIFRYTPALKTTTNKKLALDIRNDDGLLYCEPSKYIADGKTHKYKFMNLPDEISEIPECPKAVLDYINNLYKPVLSKEEKKKVAVSAKKDAHALDKMKADISLSQEDIRTVLMSINQEHAEDYHDWIKVGLALYNAKMPWELFDEFSQRSKEGYEEGKCFYTWNSFKHREQEDPITLKTLYWWLKQENPEVFATLINQQDNAEYVKMKTEFEKDNFIVGTKLCHLHQNGTRSFISDTEARLLYANREFKVYDGEKVKKQPFYNIWLKDPKRKQYDRMDFCPDMQSCPESVYNLFKGLKGGELQMDMTPEEIKEAIEPVLYHIGTLTSQNPEYFIRWLANIIQTPHIKSQTSIVLRDVSKMLKPGGGTGKNLFIEWFGEKLLGDEYFLVLGNNSLLYDQFTEHLEHKLLVYIEEAKGRDNMREIDTLKASITSKSKMINRKGVPKYMQNDFARYIWGTNNENPLPTYGGTPGDRRMWFVDVETTHRNDADYFAALTDHLELPTTQYAFYQYLLKYDTWKKPIDFQMHRPITQAYIDMRRLNADLILRWVIHRVERKNEIKGASAHLFQNFRDWMVKRNEKKADDCHISLTYFTQYLTKNSELMQGADPSEGLYKCNTSHIRLDMDRLRGCLIQHHYLHPGIEGFAIVEDDEEEEVAEK